MVRGAKRARGDDGGARDSEASDAVDARRLQRVGQAHRRQNSGQPPRQHRLPHPGWAQQQNVMDTIPASPLPSGPRLGVGADHEAEGGATPAAVPAGS